MESDEHKTILYKRSNFATRLPLSFLYSPSHAWLSRRDGVWRVGFTKFATRMLGDVVDHGFGVEPGAAITTGQIIGWVEGFKAISDLYSTVDGTFRGGNPGLKTALDSIDRDCQGAGWLYEAEGQPSSLCMDAPAYLELLDKTIDKILEKQKASEAGA